MTVLDQFSLKGKTAIVTGSEGMMGKMICETITELGGIVVSVDIKQGASHILDITDKKAVRELSRVIQADILINNAIGNQTATIDPFETLRYDLDVGLIGAVNMTFAFAPKVILNIGSDLSLIGPDQSLYKKGWYKPISYSIVKHGMVGLTRWFATSWPDRRCNCLCPGGVDVGQKTPHVPMGRLAQLEEMKGPVAFLISNASSYMTGAVLSVDGGRTCW